MTNTHGHTLNFYLFFSLTAVTKSPDALTNTNKDAFNSF